MNLNKIKHIPNKDIAPCKNVIIADISAFVYIRLKTSALIIVRKYNEHPTKAKSFRSEKFNFTLNRTNIPNIINVADVTIVMMPIIPVILDQVQYACVNSMTMKLKVLTYVIIRTSDMGPLGTSLGGHPRTLVPSTTIGIQSIANIINPRIRIYMPSLLFSIYLRLEALVGLEPTPGRYECPAPPVAP